MGKTSALQWSSEVFGRGLLGDARRTRRLVEMGAAAARRPSGKVSVVFDRAADREGAYDFLESPHAKAEAIAASVFSATVEQARGAKALFAAIDGSALTLTDKQARKGFGPVGSSNHPVRGLRVMSAYVVDNDGVPLGLVDQLYWSRPETKKRTRAETTAQNRQREFKDKETRYFVEAAKNAKARLDETGVPVWAVIDREGDNRDILLGLQDVNCNFIVRSSWNRRTLDGKDDPFLKEALEREPVLGAYEVEMPRTGSRPARRSVLEVRAKAVELRFKGRSKAKPEARMSLYVVRVREVSKSEASSPPLEWILYTNVPVTTAGDARRIVDSYRARWRIEEFHRTWKRGDCNVEDAQLRSVSALVKWATILAAVATRVERLKYFARSKPELPASVELTTAEIDALKLDRNRRTTRRISLPEMPTIGEATRWIAEMGGWMGLKSSGPPGSTTLARGLERLAMMVDAIALARRAYRPET
jgi:hypothetical protein